MKTITKTVLYLQMTALLLSAAVSGYAAAEKEVPFRGTIQGVELTDVQFPKLFVDGSGSGNATHLGRFTVTYEVEVDLLTREIFGSSLFTAANGDSLTTEHTALGTPTENPDVHSIVEMHTITGGTGRFAGATGSFIKKSLLNLVTGVTSGSFSGTIVIHKAKHTGAANAAPVDKFVAGESAVIAGATVSTWARVNGGGKVIWVGITFPLSLAENMPPPGAGPARAIAVLNFPPVVQATTYFNHVEIHSNQQGHGAAGADPHRFEVPHFDFHCYGIPSAAVLAIPPGPFFAPVPAERLPEGYGQPEPFSVPQMGRHASTLDEAAATDHWLLTMIAGFLPNASYMHFIEPMITQEFLLRRENFTLPVPMPAVLGRSTRYPTECVVHYDKDADAYQMVFKGFESIQ